MARNTILSRNRLELCHGAKLRRKCNRKHNHTERAGRETKLIQTYTTWIVKIIMKGINQHIIDNFWQMCSRSLSGEVKDILKQQMSSDSESPRSHGSRTVHSVGCTLPATAVALGVVWQRLLVRLLWHPRVFLRRGGGLCEGRCSLH